MKNILLLIVLLASGFNYGQQLHCSAFVSTEDDIILAKNFDWELGNGLIILNPEGKIKNSVYSNDTRWVSKFNSITFNHLGLNQPLGGMNEAGLTIEELSTWPVDYYFNKDTPGLTEFEWIQYQLDKYSTVGQVISNIYNSSIIKFGFNIHYILADAEGDAAVIEFINKNPVIYKKDSPPFLILTNNNYNVLQKYLNLVPESHFNKFNMNNSQDRYLKIYDLLGNKFSPDTTPRYMSAMNILDTVSVEDTRWSLVYDITNRHIYFKTHLCIKIETIAFPDDNTDNDHYYYCPIGSDCQFKFKDLTSKDNYRYLKNLKNDILNLGTSDGENLIERIELYLE